MQTTKSWIGNWRALAAAVLASLAALGASQARATTITYAGSLTDFGAGWRDSSVAKGGFDIARAGIFGADGYSVAGAQGSVSRPTYLTSLTSNGAVYGGNSNYRQIDNPSVAYGQPVSLIRSGTLNPFPGTNNAATTYTLTIGANAPALLQVGVMVDNLDIAGFNSRTVQLSGTGATGTPSVDLSGTAYNNRVVDWIFFDIASPVTGEVFTIQNFGGPNGCACVGAIAFDSTSAPEPMSAALLGVGLLGLAAYRRRSGLLPMRRAVSEN
jgi:hypothetical protein